MHRSRLSLIGEWLACANPWMLSIGFLSFLVLFVLYARHFRFNPTLENYVRYIFILIFHVSAVVSFVLWDAYQFLKQSQTYEPSYFGFAVIVLLGSALGGLLGKWLAWFFVTKKIKKAYLIANLLVALSLIFPLFLIAMPVFQMPLNNPILDQRNRHQGIRFNYIHLKRTDAAKYALSIRTQFKDVSNSLTDTIRVVLDDPHTLSFRTRVGFNLAQYISEDEIASIQTTVIANKQQDLFYVVLATMPAKTGQSDLWLFNRLGECVYYEQFSENIWQLRYSNNRCIVQQMKLDSSFTYQDYWLYHF